MALLTWLAIRPMAPLHDLLNASLVVVFPMSSAVDAQRALAMLLDGVKNAQLAAVAEWNEATVEQLLGPSRPRGLSIMFMTASPAGKSGVLLALPALPALLVLPALEALEALEEVDLGAMARWSLTRPFEL